MSEDELDCVKMKREIQAQLEKEWEGLDLHEVAEKIRENLATSESPLARKWREKLEWDKAHGVAPSERDNR